MTFYLNKSITPTTIAEAAHAGIVGLKVYPVGVTTNSVASVLDFRSYYLVLEAIQAHDPVLNQYGEAPSTPSPDFLTTDSGDSVIVLNAETMFLPTLHKLHADFPGLRFVLEREEREKRALQHARGTRCGTQLRAHGCRLDQCAPSVDEC